MIDPAPADVPQVLVGSSLGKARVLYPSGVEPSEGVEIVLVRPNVIDAPTYLSGLFREGIGVMSLSSHLESAGVRHGVLDATLFQCSAAETVALAVGPAPRWVGISAYCTLALNQSLELARAVKETRPETLVVLGGHGATFVSREILEEHPSVDAVVRSEGEEPLLRLLRARNDEERAGIPGLSCRVAGRVVENAAAPLPRQLDDAPVPSRRVREAMEGDPVLSRTPFMVLASRGCYDRCAYCTVHEFHGGWRGRSVKGVVDEVEDLVRRFSWRTVHFWDDQFAGPGRSGRRRAVELARELERRDLGIVFHVTIRPTDVDEEVVGALARAGLRSVFLGVESADERLLREFFGKHIRPDDSLRAVDVLWRHGVHRHVVGFMLFHPEMSWASFEKDLDYLDRFPCLGHGCLTSRTVYYPGSQLWHRSGASLVPGAYRDVHLPALPGEPFQRLFSACCALTNQARGLELIFECLEERHLADPSSIDLLAACRVRLFRFLSARARRVAALLERGADHRAALEEACEEALSESFRILDAVERRFAGPYFENLLLANRLVGYRHLLDGRTEAS